MNTELTPDKFLSQEELLNLKKHIEGVSNRDAIMIRFALATGARASEILAVTLKDLDQRSRTVFIYGLKGSNNREIPLSAELFRTVYALAVANPDRRPFNISHPRLTQVWHMYRPCEKGFHSLRHTFAINLYRRTKDIKLVKQALGHKSITNTMIYMEFSYSQSEMRRLIVTR